jgi:predicted amidohydrolase
VRVNREALAAESAAVVLGAEGLIVSPGFWDDHAHVATSIHEHPVAENSIPANYAGTEEVIETRGAIGASGLGS